MKIRIWCLFQTDLCSASGIPVTQEALEAEWKLQGYQEPEVQIFQSISDFSAALSIARRDKSFPDLLQYSGNIENKMFGDQPLDLYKILADEGLEIKRASYVPAMGLMRAGIHFFRLKYRLH